MPLTISSLKTSPGLPGAGGASYPATRAACAQAWADAMESYAAAVVPASTTVAAAAATLSGALNTAFGAADAAAVATAMEAAFLAFATTVGGGMAPAFVAVPPPAPVGFSTLFGLTAPATRQIGVDRFADAIDTWMLTGTATPSGGGAPVNWS